MTKLFGIDFTPLREPFRRHLETVAMSYLLLIEPLIIICGIYYVIFRMPITYYWILGVYAIYYYYDFNSFDEGGWNWTPGRHWKFFWQLVVDYFPIKLIKTSELSPDNNYIFVVQPHGYYLSLSNFNFTNEVNQVSELYKGLRFRILTLASNFKIPLHREIYYSTGCSSASKKNINYILGNSTKGEALVLYAGGEQEAHLAAPRTCRVYIKNRKGFVKLAIQNGAHLVPVITFGEGDVFKLLDFGNKSRKVANCIRNVLRKVDILLPLVKGRGYLQNSFGVLPKRHEIVSVVGNAITVHKNCNPSQKEIDDLHQVYVNSLVQLYEDHKDKHGYGDVPLELY